LFAFGFGPEGVFVSLDEGGVEECGEGFMDRRAGLALLAREETELDEGVETFFGGEEGDAMDALSFASF
jgi:hypothetical protein